MGGEVFSELGLRFVEGSFGLGGSVGLGSENYGFFVIWLTFRIGLGRRGQRPVFLREGGVGRLEKESLLEGGVGERIAFFGMEAPVEEEGFLVLLLGMGLVRGC